MRLSHGSLYGVRLRLLFAFEQQVCIVYSDWDFSFLVLRMTWSQCRLLAWPLPSVEYIECGTDARAGTLKSVWFFFGSDSQSDLFLSVGYWNNRRVCYNYSLWEAAFSFILLDTFNRWQRNEMNILMQDRKRVLFSLKSVFSSWTHKSCTTSSASRTSRHKCRPRTQNLWINVPHESPPLHFRWGNIWWPAQRSGKLLLPTLWQVFLCLCQLFSPFFPDASLHPGSGIKDAFIHILIFPGPSNFFTLWWETVCSSEVS